MPSRSMMIDTVTSVPVASGADPSGGSAYPRCRLCQSQAVASLPVRGRLLKREACQAAGRWTRLPERSMGSCDPAGSHWHLPLGRRQYCVSAAGSTGSHWQPLGRWHRQRPPPYGSLAVQPRIVRPFNSDPGSQVSSQPCSGCALQLDHSTSTDITVLSDQPGFVNAFISSSA